MHGVGGDWFWIWVGKDRLYIYAKMETHKRCALDLMHVFLAVLALLPAFSALTLLFEGEVLRDYKNLSPCRSQSSLTLRVPK